MQSNSSKRAKKISDARQQSLDKLDTNKKPDNRNDLSTKSISQKGSESKKSRRGKSKQNKHLTINSRTLTLALKFYPEQLLSTDERKAITNSSGRIDYSLWKDGNLLDYVKKLLNSRIKSFSSYFDALKSPQDKSKRHWEVAGICHDKDEVANPDDMFAPSVIKPHFHVIIRDANNKRFFVKTVLKALGLNYRKEDSQLFYEHGCTTIADFNAYLMYLTHETEQAVRDGKELYDLSELMTNMTSDEVSDLRAGYSRLQTKSKLSDKDWNELADYAGKLGDKMGNFDDWSKHALTFSQRCGRKFSGLQEVFNVHLADAVEQAPDLTRCCILITGKENDGKSWTSRHVLLNFGETLYRARKGSGKYDGLKSTTTAMLFDDRMISDALNATDNAPAVLHGRGTGGDKPWLGHYLVVTTNLSSDDFFKAQVGYDAQLDAIKSRFYICKLAYDSAGHGKLILKTPSIRGKKSDVERRHKMYAKFADEFNRLIADYTPLTAEDAPQLDPTYFNRDFVNPWKSSPNQPSLLGKYNTLQAEYEKLQKEFSELQASYNSLMKNYTMKL